MGFHMPASASANSAALSSSKGFFVYIHRCSDDSLYVGHPSNVEERVKIHNDGRGALWTACRRPIHLVYQERHPSEAKAIGRERQLKRWSHGKKLALINGDVNALKSLAMRKMR